MRSSLILLTALAVTLSQSAFGVPLLSTYELSGTPINGLAAVLPIPNPRLRVSLNPVPAPLLPDPNSFLNLVDPTKPVYFYPQNPTFEIEDFSFDIEQVLNIGSGSGGAGAGKSSFNQFQVTQTDTVAKTLAGFSQLVDQNSQVLETVAVSVAGLDPNSLVATSPGPILCGAVPCADLILAFSGIGNDPTVTFSVSSGTTDFAFSEVPEPATASLFGFGVAIFGCMRLRRRAALAANQQSG